MRAGKYDEAETYATSNLLNKEQEAQLNTNTHNADRNTIKLLLTELIRLNPKITFEEMWDLLCR